jgi:hypothetical protein
MTWYVESRDKRWMRLFGTLLLFPLCLASQSERPYYGLLRGVLLESNARAGSGELTVRAQDNRLFRYRFDSRTYVEREDVLVDGASLLPGDILEIVSDRSPDVRVRYARTIHVILPPPALHPLSMGRVWAYSRPDRDRRAMREPDLTLAGVVFRIDGSEILVHTRQQGDQKVLLRPDTRYFQNGTEVDSDALKPNTRIFIEAGKNLRDEIEAYQVVWGSILRPQ